MPADGLAMAAITIRKLVQRRLRPIRLPRHQARSRRADFKHILMSPAFAGLATNAWRIASFVPIDRARAPHLTLGYQNVYPNHCLTPDGPPFFTLARLGNRLPRGARELGLTTAKCLPLEGLRIAILTLGLARPSTYRRCRPRPPRSHRRVRPGRNAPRRAPAHDRLACLVLQRAFPLSITCWVGQKILTGDQFYREFIFYRAIFRTWRYFSRLTNRVNLRRSHCVP
jgi:hypothetical protein